MPTRNIVRELRNLNPEIKIREIDFIVMKTIVAEAPLVLPEGYMVKNGFLSPWEGGLPIKLEVNASYAAAKA